MIIVDTGFWVALANKNDDYHEAAKKTFSQYNEPLITTWCVVTETCYFLQVRAEGLETKPLHPSRGFGDQTPTSIERVWRPNPYKK
ncbi:type II toxin-antitoxin system VapC family toxin [Phormidium pseudopriestleyi]|uniref:type II toxin-antitoxin system VapC family toxin n=1 Tax=Phormidium pseudopriestleyi TaxID=1759527 RepID=UPI0030F4B112